MSAYLLDARELHRRVDEQRRARGLSWSEVARQTGCAKSLFTKLGTGGGTLDVHNLVTLLVWLGLADGLAPLLVSVQP